MGSATMRCYLMQQKQHYMVKKLLFITFLVTIVSCQEAKVTPVLSTSTLALLEKSKLLQERALQLEQKVQSYQATYDTIEVGAALLTALSDDAFVDVEKISTNFILDIKYATNDNFLNEAVYSCAKCYVRAKMAKALYAVSKKFMKLGYRIKLFDCYRPYSVQKAMWKLYPNPGYVADPKGGSIHNRGAAVDMTLTDLTGQELDMGTAFDHFGREANHTYTQLPAAVLANRKLLRSTMEAQGFSIIRTEWWHYNYKTTPRFPIADFRWECE